jgi:hypothetical protein
MQYHAKSELVNTTSTLVNTTSTMVPVPRPKVDAHGLLHKRASKAAKACDAADAADGRIIVQNLTLKLLAVAYGVSVGYVVHARRLSPEQRSAVRRGQRSLILPRAPATPSTPSVPPTAPVTPPVPPVVMDAKERLKKIIDELGADIVFDLLVATTNERIAA